MQRGARVISCCGQGSSRGRLEDDKTRRRAVDGSMRISLEDDITRPLVSQIGGCQNRQRCQVDEIFGAIRARARRRQVVVNYTSEEERRQQQGLILPFHPRKAKTLFQKNDIV